MKHRSSTVVAMLHVAYWIGIVLDALAFAQMAFPELGRKMLQVSRELDTAYVFAINLGAGLMLAWTLLLFWADRRPLERHMVIPLTMIIIAWNTCTMICGVRVGLVPARSMLPQIIAVSAAFLYYGLCTILAFGEKAGAAHA